MAAQSAYRITIVIINTLLILGTAAASISFISQIGYTLPNNLFHGIGVSKLRVYVSAENLFTITKYTGYDPEVGGGVFGIDKGQYPQARTFIGGVQLSF